MTAGHNHSHATTGRTLRTALVLTLVILAVELVGGIVSHSLALLSDAGHVCTDIFALGLAWFATSQAQKPADARNTYGRHRFGILATLVNAVTLILIVAVIAYEAIQRLQHPVAVSPWLMFVSAGAGIVVNLYIGFGLRGESDDNLNIRAAMLHVFGDVGAAAAVIIGGAIILASHWYPADPLISLAIAGLIAGGAWSILRETVDILMEATPKGLDLGRLVADMQTQRGVQDVHDLHVWALAGGMSCLSAHVQVEDGLVSERDSVVVNITRMLQSRYHIGHTTLQLECAGCEAQHLYCEMAPGGEVGEHYHAHDGPAIGGTPVHSA
jgi:cobalt-zinc-cadmium efflux system protein